MTKMVLGTSASITYYEILFTMGYVLYDSCFSSRSIVGWKRMLQKLQDHHEGRLSKHGWCMYWICLLGTQEAHLLGVSIAFIQRP